MITVMRAITTYQSNMLYCNDRYEQRQPEIEPTEAFHILSRESVKPNIIEVDHLYWQLANI